MRVLLKRIIPVEAGFQPVHMDSGAGRERLIARVRKYSTIPLMQIH